MAPRQALDDPNKKCILLSADDTTESEDEDRSDFPSLPPFTPRDLPDGYELRLQEYHNAWSRCLERVQSLVRSLHTPVVEAVCSSVRTAHSKSHELPGLPFPELPVVAVSAPGSNSSVVSDVVASLERHGRTTASGGGDAHSACIISQLYPADCPNLMTAMKSLVTSFVDRTDEDGEQDNHGIRYPPFVRRKATTSLAVYDMNLLKAWYNALAAMNENRYPLVIVLHAFEQFDSNVTEVMFNICSQFLPDIPLVFLLSMSAPSPSSFIRTAFPRRTLQLLRVDVHTAPSGTDVVESVIEKTFFDLEWAPDFMLGSGVLNFIASFSERHTASLDALLAVLQIAHLKHIEEPLTLFVQNSLLGCSSIEIAYQKLQDLSSEPFLDALRARIDSPSADLAEILFAVDEARANFTAAAERMRLAYKTLRLLQDFMSSYKYRSSPYTAEGGTEEPRLQFMARVVQGKVAKDVQHLVRMVSKLRRDQLEALLEKLNGFFYTLEPPQLRLAESKSREFIVRCRSVLPQPRDQANGESNLNGDARATVAEAAADLAEWLSSYISQRLEPLDKCILAEVWFTGASPFPSELLNPAPRPAIVHALLHPHSVLTSHRLLFNADGGDAPTADERPTIWDLPDTSILFHRYMEAPKKVNVYDWFMSFAQVLETQRERARAKEREEKSKGKGKGRGKGSSTKSARKTAQGGKEKEGDEPGEERGEEGDEEDEEWQIELQARFIRALHELDYMGFIKHTGRKADHIVKTVYDVYE